MQLLASQINVQCPVISLENITPLILTYNEAPNVGDMLARLKWARRVVVVDSVSTDDTVEIAEQFENVVVLRRPFDDHTTQWNFGLRQVATPWVLALDSDYRCPAELADELRTLSGDCDAYLSNFTYCIDGKPLRGTLYPPRAVLFRPERCHYMQDGHTQTLVHDPLRTRTLATKLMHDDRKPLSHWLASQSKYAELEVAKLLETPASRLGWKDRLRRWYVIAPALMLLYCLFMKRLAFDGRAGLHYTLQRVYAELLLSLTLLDHRLRSVADNRPNQSKTEQSTNNQRSTTVENYEHAHPGN